MGRNIEFWKKKKQFYKNIARIKLCNFYTMPRNYL